MFKKILLFTTTTFFYFVPTHAQNLEIAVFSENKNIGQIEFKDSPYGLMINPKLAHLPPGPHGIHVHEHPDCRDHGMQAMGHFDPNQTKHHLGPYGNGHLGDLPVLVVDANGEAKIPVLAPRLKLKDILNRALMIHAGSDTYSDIPELGGGGARIACGIIQNKNK